MRNDDEMRSEHSIMTIAQVRIRVRTNFVLVLWYEMSSHFNKLSQWCRPLKLKTWSRSNVLLRNRWMLCLHSSCAQFPANSIDSCNSLIGRLQPEMLWFENQLIRWNRHHPADQFDMKLRDNPEPFLLDIEVPTSSKCNNTHTVRHGQWATMRLTPGV